MILPGFETLLIVWTTASVVLGAIAFAVGLSRAARDRARERSAAPPTAPPPAAPRLAPTETVPSPPSLGAEAPSAEVAPVEATPLEAPPVEAPTPVPPREPPPAHPPELLPAHPPNWRVGLRKSRVALMGRLEALFGGRAELDAQMLDRVEEVLFGADIGVQTADDFLQVVRRARSADEMRGALEARALEILGSGPVDGSRPRGSPHVLLVVGVNGSGKTTTIGKLAARWVREGQQVLVVAADTFRAAATEQLEVWAGRAGAEFVRGPSGGDPAAVAFDAVKLARARGLDAVLIDTAGRLQTRSDLMDQLTKIGRVVKKELPDAPHEVLLVLDANIGQNAIRQAQEFSRAVEVSGIVLAKLDGTAKGGVVLGIAQEVGIPVRYVGLGEGIDDLVDFDPESFVRALFETEEDREQTAAPADA